MINPTHKKTVVSRCECSVDMANMKINTACFVSDMFVVPRAKWLLMVTSGSNLGESLVSGPEI